MLKAKPEVEALKPYVAPLEGRREMLRLDFNENTVSPSPKVLEAIRNLGPEAYATYPEYAGLNEAYAEQIGVGAEFIEAFNGVDAAIKAIFDTYGEKGRTFLTTTPTFGYYTPCAQQQGMVIEQIPYADDLSYPLEAVRKGLQKNPRLLFICNPNNPTGTMLEPDIILDLAKSAPETLIVVDELYAAFTEKSVISKSFNLENVVVLQSLSKSSGIAALRLGFAVGHPSILERLTRVTGPYDINMFAVVAGKAALSDPQHTAEYIEQVRTAKAWTVERLKTLGVRCFSEGGNFLLVWPPVECAKVETALRAKGILVRNMAGKAVIDGSFRLTIGTLAQMQDFMKAFEEICGS